MNTSLAVLTTQSRIVIRSDGFCFSHELRDGEQNTLVSPGERLLLSFRVVWDPHEVKLQSCAFFCLARITEGPKNVVRVGLLAVVSREVIVIVGGTVHRKGVGFPKISCLIGQPLVIVHGLPESSRCWMLVWEVENLRAPICPGF